MIFGTLNAFFKPNNKICIMKTIEITNRSRILTTVGLLIFLISISFGQNLFSEVTYNEYRQGDSFLLLSDVNETGIELLESNVNGSRTITISAIEVNYEAELETEDWMSTSFSESFERELSIENWMTQPLSGSLEPELETEDWMIAPFNASLEDELAVEDWMTRSLI